MNQPNRILPDWLKQTQNNSWEPEVFISGIVLFGLLQVPDLLEGFRFFFRREVYGFTTEIDNLIAVLMTSVQWLTFGLVLHLFFRGVWIGLVGLSYVFPKGISNDSLNYKGKFENRVKTIPDFSDQIILLEKISSSIFSISYFIFMSILGAYVYLFVAIIIPVYSITYVSGVSFAELDQYPVFTQMLNVYLSTILGIGFIYMLDFLSLGLLKKNKIIAKFYYPFYRFVSILTLSALHRNIYYILISNFKKWKVILFISIFLGITFFMIDVNGDRAPISRQFSQQEMYGSSYQNAIQKDSYNNLNPDPKYQNASIQSDIIKGDVLKLFVTHYADFEDSIKVHCDHKVLETSHKRDSLNLLCMKEFYMISVDDSLYTDIDWYFHYNPQTTHRGILTYMDISHLDKGMHKVSVELKNYFYKDFDVIQFYKE